MKNERLAEIIVQMENFYENEEEFRLAYQKFYDDFWHNKPQKSDEIDFILELITMLNRKTITISDIPMIIRIKSRLLYNFAMDASIKNGYKGYAELITLTENDLKYCKKKQENQTVEFERIEWEKYANDISTSLKTIKLYQNQN